MKILKVWSLSWSEVFTSLTSRLLLEVATLARLHPDGCSGGLGLKADHAPFLNVLTTTADGGDTVSAAPTRPAP